MKLIAIDLLDLEPKLRDQSLINHQCKLSNVTKSLDSNSCGSDLFCFVLHLTEGNARERKSLTLCSIFFTTSHPREQKDTEMLPGSNPGPLVLLGDALPITNNCQ